MNAHAISHHRTVAAAGGRWSLGRAFHFTMEHFLLLPIGGLIALVWANVGPEGYFTFAHRLAFAVNEVGMAVFFALITQEIIEAIIPGGALHTWRRWMLPLVAAAGGSLGSAVVYLAYVEWKYEPVLSQGWLVACAYDLAFGYFVVRSIFRRHAAVAFFLVMAIFTSAVGIVALAIQYQTVEIHSRGTMLMLAALGLAALLRRQKVGSFWPYVVLCGPLSWWALFLNGLHPALALVPIVPFLPHAARRLELFTDAPHGVHDSRSHVEHVWNYPVQAILFLFGLVNAGVLIQEYGTGTWAFLAAALLGRPLGVLAAVGAAVLLGFHLPARLRWPGLVVVALTASSGFTFALFAATVVYPAGPILGELKIGAVLSGVGVVLAFAAARLLRVGRFAAPGHA
jgi:Na+:H+ antiporter, NhaA family